MKRARYIPTSELLAIARSAFGATFELRDANSRLFDTVDQVAIVSIEGPLTRHDEWLWDSYDAVRQRLAAALASPCRTVILRIDSPGGEAIGCFDVARELRAMAAAAGKTLIAYADGMAASGGYALACAASRIYVPADGFVGSIGVKKAIVDATGLDRLMGLSITVVGSGARKLDGEPHMPTSEAAVAEAQGQVDSLAALFFALVGDARGMSPDAVRGLEAGVFHGEQAVSVGLADGVLTFNELLAMVANGAPPKASTAAEKPMTKEEMRAWLSEKAKGEGDEADKAKAALKCLDEEEKPKNDTGDADEDKDKKKEGETRAEGDPPPPPKDDEKKDDAKAMVSLTARVHSLEAQLSQKEDREKREKLLATRADFSNETRATLMSAPFAMLKEAVEKWPRIVNPAAAATAQGTRGETQTGDGATALPPDEAKLLDERMGLTAMTGSVKHEGRVSTFEVITTAKANEILKKKGAA